MWGVNSLIFRLLKIILIMNANETKKTESFQKIIDLLKSYSLSFESDEMTKRQITSFTAMYAELAPWRIKMEQPTQWITREKNEGRKLLTPQVWVLTVAANRFANAQKDEKLLDTVRKSKSEIRNMSQTDLVIFANCLTDLAKANAEAFVPFSITAEFITEYDILLGNWESKIGERHLLLNEKKIAKGNHKVLLSDMTQFLNNKLDWSIESYSQKQPDVVNDYFAARKLPKSPVHHIDLRGLIIDATNEEPVTLGVVTVVETGEMAKITAKGHFNFKHFPEGEFTLKIENLAYKTIMITVRRYAEEHLYLTIKLEAKPEPHPIT